MSMAGGAENERKVDQTPTLAVALVCAVFILISIFLEKWTSSHLTGTKYVFLSFHSFFNLIVYTLKKLTVFSFFHCSGSQITTRSLCLKHLRGLNQVSLQINKQPIEM